MIGVRTREGLSAVRAQGKTISRPAVADTAKLRGRIERMRARGMTLQAIADKLNRDRVPTIRGGKSGDRPALSQDSATSVGSHAVRWSSYRRSDAAPVGGASNE